MKKLYTLVIVIFTGFIGHAQIINIPDANFKQELLISNTANGTAQDLDGNNLAIDANGNNEIEVSEALQVSFLNLNFKAINSLTGLAYFTNLKTLDCSGNPLTVLDVSTLTLLENLHCEYANINSLNLNGLTQLQTLTCQESHLNSLTVNGLVNLTSLRCDTNNLTSLDVSSLTSLTELQCNENQLTSLIVSGATQLQTLNCKTNQIPSLNINGLVNLTSLDCSSNQIASLILVGFPNLFSVYCTNNLITNLDVREIPNLSILSCSGNLLTTLYLNNGSEQNPFIGTFGNNATLTSVCIDPEEASYFQSYTCTVSTSCSAFNYYFVSRDDNFFAKLLQANTTNNIAKDSNGNSIKIDSNNDGRIDENEIANVYQLDVSNASIIDMYGIRRFTHLTKLVCKTNQIQNLDLTGLTNLTYLDCSFNNLTALNTSALTNLQTLLNNNNQIATMNLAANVNLLTLNCSNNQLTTLNINALTNLTTLNCSSNALLTINIETLTALSNLNCASNNLTSLYIKNGINESSLVFSGNPGLIYVCCDAVQTAAVQALITSYGYTGCTLASTCTFAGALFADPNFNTKLLQASTTNQIAKNLTGNWTKVDANNNGIITAAEAQNISYLDVSNAQINDLSGINNFTNLHTLICANNQIAALNLSTQSQMVTLDCSNNQLETLNINGLNNLVTLNCSRNNLIALSVNGLTHLQTIECYDNYIMALNVTGLNNLQNLTAFRNQLQTLNASGLTSLLTLSVGTNLLTSINLSGLTNLQNLNCAENQLTTLNVSSLTSLQQLGCNSNQLTTLNLTGLTNLQTLDCSSNQFSTISLSGLNNLRSLKCANNQLSTLNLSSQSNLNILDCSYNQMPTINLSGLIALQDLNCSINQLATINLSGLNALQILDCSGNQLTTLTVNNLSNLQNLKCDFNQLQALNVNGMSNLIALGCSWNQLATLDLSGAANLEQVNCSHNLLTTLNVTGLIHLYTIKCSENELNSINLSGLTSLGTLECSSNLFTVLDLTGLTNLYWLDCQNNQITTLNVNGFTQLFYFTCASNPITSLFMKTGHYISELDYYSIPALEYICTDDDQIAAIETRNTAYGYTNCHVNSYCSFTPGGVYYTVQGNTKYDGNNNGCDGGDMSYPNLKLSFSDGTNSGNIIADTTGSYHNTIEAGTHTFSPVLENPTYFNISPTTASVTFPTTVSPFTKDFCVSSNGIHNDLEVAIIPTNNARPGFDSTYKILYKNKGTQTQNGAVNFTFNDDTLDLVAANPATSSQGVNTLNWSFSNLQPFESRTILVTLNLNTPSETPALNSGDILNYTATITGVTDETIDDNTATVNQEVINSLDPNDKTCLEGETVSQVMVGKYVHYAIRFENNGTANAQNIVVKDIIDTTKYDIASLIPLSASASYVTKIKNTNQVEFIFENINLPFDDATNDGYVAFKIKTKPTLVTGDSFSNTADIYFDYNFPITTNTATTTIATLGSQDFEFGSVYTLSPVPAKNLLHIATKQTVAMRSASIYNQLGQLIQVTTTPSKTIDVSSLKTGTYFIKVVSDKGTATSKFIKE